MSCNPGVRVQSLSTVAFLFAGCSGDGNGESAVDGAVSHDANAATADATVGWGAGCEPEPGDSSDIDGEGNKAFLGFEIHGSGFEMYEAAALRAMTFLQDDPSRVYGATETTIDAEGEFEIMWVRGYSRFYYQTLIYYVDVDQDGRCDADVDFAWGHPSNAHNPTMNEPLRWDLSLIDFNGMDPVVACEHLNRCASDE